MFNDPAFHLVLNISVLMTIKYEIFRSVCDEFFGQSDCVELRRNKYIHFL